MLGLAGGVGGGANALSVLSPALAQMLPCALWHMADPVADLAGGRGWVLLPMRTCMCVTAKDAVQVMQSLNGMVQGSSGAACQGAATWMDRGEVGQDSMRCGC